MIDESNQERSFKAGLSSKKSKQEPKCRSYKDISDDFSAHG